jgi:CheY-like chemotaxis protein
MSLEPKLILLADDEPDIVLVTKTRIELNGYRVETAGDGAEALEKVRRLKPSLVLLDLKMPKLDGYQVCKEIKADLELRTIPILLFSASSTYAATLERRCILLGAEGYLRKPFAVGELISKIQGLTGGPSAVRCDGPGLIGHAG